MEQDKRKLFRKITTKNVLNFDDDSDLKAEMEAMISDEERQVRFEQKDTIEKTQKDSNEFIIDLKNTREKPVW